MWDPQRSTSPHGQNPSNTYFGYCQPPARYCKAVTYDSEMAGSGEATRSSFMALGKVALAAQTAAKEAGLGDVAPAEDCHS
ncbi:hypothetical protein AK812_SmicGene3208 [Symbiodinium microadriaticum]|uniref:Uncharacterized protein n=1 Tax=Symbiodinium microadriaticum TaxID=2951 RepID=A0A1Q9EZH9_SYMMI|nr:hypothetical protein AK812_SmicGene3208 [Symbiodinium microadriaticum]